MSVTLPRGGEAALDAIETLSRSGLSAQQLLVEAADSIARVVPSAGRFYAAADPETGLCMGAGIAEMPEEVCVPFWEHEFHVPDFNKFADLAHGPVPVADLHAATGGRPSRSPRWRAFQAEFDYDAELRAAFALGGSVWGVAQLSRATGERPFSEDEIGFVAEASTRIAEGLRDSLTTTPAGPIADRGPGMAVLDGEGRLISMTAEADEWMREMDSAMYPPGLGVRMPIEIAALAASARHAGSDGPRRLRMRTAGGMWLLAHASPLGGTDGHVALVIEPAKASEVAPLIIEAYGLTPRELEVTRMIARGLKTAEIAGQLFLSPHTVRDHVKAIFEKVGVRSRGELVATMFADHYHGGLDAAIVASGTPT